eukprot:TRINITY_DN677_c0_g1_i2.p1 TRINITY_DN677_c0_g1~~TRINITY_DN677_c0_g1_i2.p1  ORF type:complete len:205 (-),score=33.30 TRINITY_DN677_c0_g1_i2:318-932(-)
MNDHNREFVVRLNLYDLVENNWNDTLYNIGLGIHHSGIEIDGREITFGRHEGDTSGIFATPPGATGLVRRESRVLGTVVISPNRLRTILDQMGNNWTGTSYHPIHRNCNHFCNALCSQLLNEELPSYINRLAYMGSFIQCILPGELGLPAPTDQNNIVDESYAVPFQGEGVAIGSSTTTAPPTNAETRRALFEKAAMNRFNKDI